MGYIIGSILMLLLSGGSVFGFFRLRSAANDEKESNAANQYQGDNYLVRGWRVTFGITAGVVLFGWVLMSFLMGFTQVGSGHIGVKYAFGKVNGTVNPGVHLVAPWNSVISANTQVQKYEFHLTAFSQETQDVFVDGTLNFSVNPDESTVRSLYVNVGPDWFKKLVPTRLNQTFKDETVKYQAVEVAPNREQIRKDVIIALQDKLKRYSINVNDINIDNLDFDHAFKKAIRDKQIATQEAQAAKNRVVTAQYKADQIIKAAQGQAEANRLKRQTLTPLLVQQNAIDKLNPNVQVIVVDPNTLGFAGLGAVAPYLGK